MKAKEILKNVCVYLGKEELLESNVFNENGEELTEQARKEFNKMLISLNFLLEDIASDYIPLLKEKEITFTNGEIDVHEIDQNIQEIVGIKSKLGRNLTYKYIGSKIICIATNAIVTYKIYPNVVEGYNDEVEDFGGRLSSRVLAYGVASDYCLMDMLYDDSSIWEHRFKNALLVNMRKKGEIKLKKRGWY